MAYEIEIKSLLGAPEKATELKEKLAAVCPGLKQVSHHKQLNHYFESGDVQKLMTGLASHIADEAKQKLALIVHKGKNFSVRTREADGSVLIVLKASVDDGTSHNTVSRLEFEESVSLSLGELDRLVQDAGFRYQAKWSREREEFEVDDMHVCVDKNAGYGYLAEFEKVVEAEADIASARREIVSFMQKLGVEELPQERLERMFAHYNAHWPEYYGTDRIFTIE